MGQQKEKGEEKEKEATRRELENKIEYALAGIAILYIHLYVDVAPCWPGAC